MLDGNETEAQNTVDKDKNTRQIQFTNTFLCLDVEVHSNETLVSVCEQYLCFSAASLTFPPPAVCWILSREPHLA